MTPELLEGSRIYLRGRLHQTLEKQDFDIWSGDHVVLIFTIEDVSTVATSSAIWASARSVRSSKLIRIHECVIVDNKVQVELLSDYTEEMRRGRYYHELELTDPAGKITTAAIGFMTVKPTLIKKPEGV